MMTTGNNFTVHPYIDFNGRCEEAVEFYRKTIGAEVVMLMRFKDAPDQSMCTPGLENKVMHATLRMGESIVQTSDGRCVPGKGFAGFCLSLTLKDVGEAERYFKALGDGGHVHMPLAKTFFSPSFGLVIDQFGITWMVYVSH